MQRLTIGKSTPEQFINAQLGDWVCGVGDISTQYEVEFVRRLGRALKKTHKGKKRPPHKSKKRLLDLWDMPIGGIFVVSRKDDWRLHAFFTKEEIDEFVEFIKKRDTSTKESKDE